MEFLALCIRILGVVGTFGVWVYVSAQAGICYRAGDVSRGRWLTSLALLLLVWFVFSFVVLIGGIIPR